MKKKYNKNTKCLAFLMLLIVVFSFPSNSAAQCQLSVNSIVNVDCHADSTGSVIAEGTGALGFYYVLQYINTSNLWQQTAQSALNTPFSVQFAQLWAGSYRVLMTDSLGCSDTVNFTLVEPPAIASSGIIINESIPFVNDGSIALNVSGGTPGYIYDWAGPNGFSATNQNINNLSAGIYELTITDSLGCTYDTVLVVGLVQSCGFTNSNATDLLCYADSSGSISIEGVFGISPFAYSLEFLNGSGIFTYASSDTSFVFSSIPSGSYRVLMIDSLGCSDTLPIIAINQPDSIAITTVITVASIFTACDGLIQSAVIGGVLPYSYLCNDSLSQTTVTATGLCIGQYCVTVTDSNGCVAVQCDSVGSIFPCTDSIQLSLTVNDETCRGGDGSLEILAGNGHAPYYYSINGGLFLSMSGSSVLIDSLISGNYFVVVQDSFCLTGPDTIIVPVTPSPIINSVTVINESCCGDDGQVIVLADNPLSITKYSIDTLFSWQDSAEFTNLYRGDYLVHIEDTNSCLDSMEVYVGVDSIPNINMTTQTTDIVCHGDTNGTFKVYYPDSCYDYVLWRYTLFNPQVALDTGYYFNGLIKGYYGVIATSRSGTCIDSTEIDYSNGPNIDEPDPILYESTSSAVYCIINGVCNGSISLDGLPAGGVSPYNYSLQQVYTNIPLVPIDVDSAFSGICSGEYEVQVFDANACLIRDTISVLDSSLYIDSFIVENSSCFGYANGEITVYAHGGLGTYSYLWENLETTQTIDSLSSGSYGLVVTDSLACFALDTIVIIQPNNLVFKIIETGKIPETCMGITYDGQISLEITGGTSPYNYSWTGNGISGTGIGETMTSLTYDTITISVYDANGCIAIPAWGTIDMTVVNALNADNPLIFDSVLIGNSPMCFGIADGILQIDMEGVAPYLYSIDNGITQSVNNIFTSLIASSYDIVVYDAFGCMDSTKVFFEEYNELNISVDSTKHVNCYDGSDGYISISASGGIGDFSYFWIPTFDTLAIIANLSAAPYVVQLTDSASCMISDTIILEHLTDPIQSIDLVVNNVSCFGAEDGSASIQIIGGMPFENGYTVSWMNLMNDTVAIGNFAENLASGVYLLAVTDSFLCGAFIDTIVIAQPSQFYLEVINIEHNLCYGYANGEIIVAEFGGTPPYLNYFLSDSFNSISVVSSAIFSYLTAGDYSLWSVYYNGCNSDTLFGVILDDPGKLIIQTNVTDLDCFGDSLGLIALSISAGAPPYYYELLDGNTVLVHWVVNTDSLLQTLDSLYASDFTLNISDYYACEIDTQITVNQPDEVVASFVVADAFGREQFSTSFDNLSTGANIFIWNFGDNISENKALDDEVVHTFISQGKYDVLLIAHNNNLSDLCNDTASLIINVEGYDVFNSFSPNDDMYNNTFHFNDWMIKGIDVEIFNRWGQRVYHWSGVDGYWDGRSYNGEKLPEGVYFYIMNAQGVDDYTFQEKGSVTLFR